MILDTLMVGPIGTNCYIFGCGETGEAAVIDPGDEADRILTACARHRLKVVRIINTHGHVDHVGANRRMKEVTGAELSIHEADVPMLEHLTEIGRMWGMRVDNSPAPDRFLKDGDLLTVGKLTLTVLATPGHSKGGVSLLADGLVFVGDTLFAGSIGRTDLPGGDYNELIASVRKKLFTLPDATVAYPGHGPETTIGQEKKYNPFFH